MQIGPIDQSKFYDSSSDGTGDGPIAFRNAIKSLPSSTDSSDSSSVFGSTPRSTFYDPSLSMGEDDVLKQFDNTIQSASSRVSTSLTQFDDTVQSASNKVKSWLKEMDADLKNDTAAAPPNSSAPGAAAPPADGPADCKESTAGDPCKSMSPADYLAALQNGTETGNPPDKLTLPPSTTAADVAGMNGGLLNNLNELHIQNGTPAGDAAAQKYGYKDMKTLLADKSPEAAAAAGKILWAARACNNLKEADGADRPAQEQSANTLSGITSHHEADNGSTSGAFQNWLKGTSIQSQNVFATDRTYADGGGKSNAQIIGDRIAGVFKKIFSFICPPLADLVQMAQDGATKVRDQSVGDKDAAAHDTAAIKQDGKNFGKDFGEFAANAALMLVPGAGEVGLMARGAEEAGEAGAKVAGDAARTGDKATGDATKIGGKDAARSAAGEAEPASEAPLSSMMDELKKLVFGDDFKSKLTGMHKHTTREEKEEHVKQKLKKHLDDLLQQLVSPPNSNSKSAQNGDAASSQAELLALLTQLLSLLEGSQASQSSSGSSGYQWKPGDPIGPVTPGPFVKPVALSTSQRPAEATA